MEKTRWYCCKECKTVREYAISQLTDDVPPGENPAHSDAVIAGFYSEAEAQQWLERELSGSMRRGKRGRPPGGHKRKG